MEAGEALVDDTANYDQTLGLLLYDVVMNDIALPSTTIANSGLSYIKSGFKGDHIIVYKGAKADNGDTLIVVTSCEGKLTIVSGGDKELKKLGNYVGN